MNDNEIVQLNRRIRLELRAVKIAKFVASGDELLEMLTSIEITVQRLEHELARIETRAAKAS